MHRLPKRSSRTPPSISITSPFWQSQIACPAPMSSTSPMMRWRNAPFQRMPYSMSCSSAAQGYLKRLPLLPPAMWCSFVREPTPLPPTTSFRGSSSKMPASRTSCGACSRHTSRTMASSMWWRKRRVPWTTPSWSWTAPTTTSLAISKASSIWQTGQTKCSTRSSAMSQSSRRAWISSSANASPSGAQRPSIPSSSTTMSSAPIP